MTHQFIEFIDDLRSTHGKNLVSVILYGSAADGDYIRRQSDYNILVALNEITPKDLRNAQAVLREWTRLGHSLPVYFTVGELETAADVFPIEFHQMERARKVLYGRDVLANVKISDEFLRHQTEYELRSKLIQLRRSYIPASASVDGLKTLMAQSFASFASLFRAVLILHRIDPPMTKDETVALTVRKLGLDGRTFEKIINFRENKNAQSLDEVSANQLFADYLAQIEAVIGAVDKLEKS